jgi:hypothetical protein
VIIRDGQGTGEAHGDTAGEVHDRALKAAETDATKRALVTFGKAFGLALYAGVGRPAASNRRKLSPLAGHSHSPAASTGAPSEAQPSSGPKPTPSAPNDDAASRIADSVATTDLIHDSGEAKSRSGETAKSELTSPTEADADQGQAQLNGSTDTVTMLDKSAQNRVDKSALALSEPYRIRDKAHLRFVAAQPCLLCSAAPSDAHHLRFSQPRALGRKVGDEFTVPLCRQHHRDLHDSGNEAAWWHDMGIDAMEIARQLWQETDERREGRTSRDAPSES